jgi:copper chaperone CopZ
METTNFNIKGLSDNKSVSKLKNSVSSLSGVTNVDVDLPGSKVLVTFDPTIVDITAIKNSITGSGFAFK